MYIEKIITGKRKCMLYFADAEPFGIYPSEMKEFLLEEDREIAPEVQKELENRLFARGKERAYYLLGHREHSSAELRRKLKAEGYPGFIIDRITESLLEYRYLDDEGYGHRFIKAHNQKSRRELQQLLGQKGIDRDLARQILEDGLDEEENLKRLIAKKTKGRELSPEEKQKLFRYCVSHGYGYDAVQKALEID